VVKLKCPQQNIAQATDPLLGYLAQTFTIAGYQVGVLLKNRQGIIDQGRSHFVQLCANFIQLCLLHHFICLFSPPLIAAETFCSKLFRQQNAGGGTIAVFNFEG